MKRWGKYGKNEKITYGHKCKKYMGKMWETKKGILGTILGIFRGEGGYFAGVRLLFLLQLS